MCHRGTVMMMEGALISSGPHISTHLEARQFTIPSFHPLFISTPPLFRPPFGRAGQNMNPNTLCLCWYGTYLCFMHLFVQPQEVGNKGVGKCTRLTRRLESWQPVNQTSTSTGGSSMYKPERAFSRRKSISFTIPSIIQ